MFRRFHLLLVLICLAAMPAYARPLPHAQAMAAAALEPRSPYGVLPGSCGGGLPAGGGASLLCFWLCVFGWNARGGR